jgi:predicted heme/steroid binding protein
MKYFFSIFLLSILSFLVTPAFAEDDYTSHNTPSDCYVRFEDSVYDLTEYIVLHDKYLDIRSWCGKDMTEDFMTKAGIGEDHKLSSYYLLEEYKVYDISTPPVEEENVIEQVVVDEETTKESVTDSKKGTSPYNLAIPVFLSLLVYWIPYFIMKSKKVSMVKFNGVFNTLLLLALLIPALGFGVFMMLRYKFPALYNIDFNFLYWHVELSLVMGVLGISHLLQRLNIYLLQLRRRN